MRTDRATWDALCAFSKANHLSIFLRDNHDGSITACASTSKSSRGHPTRSRTSCASSAGPIGRSSIGTASMPLSCKASVWLDESDDGYTVTERGTRQVLFGPSTDANAIEEFLTTGKRPFKERPNPNFVRRAPAARKT